VTTPLDDLGDLGDKARALVDAGRALDDPQASDRARVRSRLAATLGTSAALTAATKAGVAAAKSGGIWTTSAALGAKLLSPALVAVALSAAAGAVVWTQSSSSGVQHPSRAIRPAAAPTKPAPRVTPRPPQADVISDTGITAAASTAVGPNAAGSAPPGSAPPLARANALRTENPRPLPARSSRASNAPTVASTLASPVAPTTEPRVEMTASVSPSDASETRAEPEQPTPASSPAEQPREASAVQPAANAQRPTQASSRPGAPPRSAAAEPSALAGELSLLGAAQRALSTKQFARALALLDQHAVRYPSGSLLPERLAARAVVLCRMDRVSAGLGELRLLEARAPASPLLHWARTNCSSPGSP
jgi:hypothetical protein